MAEDTSVDFLRNFVERPQETGALVPSSQELSERLVDAIDWSRVRSAVEFGPGYGPATQEIVKRLRPGAQFFAVEINPGFAAAFAKRFPEVHLYQESVENIVSICHRHGINELDAVVSGLPWANFTDAQQDALLEATLSVMSPQAEFVTFAYLHGLMLPSGKRFRDKLEGLFSVVRRSEVVWRNTPPAFFYYCRPSSTNGGTA